MIRPLWQGSVGLRGAACSQPASLPSGAKQWAGFFTSARWELDQWV